MTIDAATVATYLETRKEELAQEITASEVRISTDPPPPGAIPLKIPDLPITIWVSIQPL